MTWNTHSSYFRQELTQMEKCKKMHKNLNFKLKLIWRESMRWRSSCRKEWFRKCSRRKREETQRKKGKCNYAVKNNAVDIKVKKGKDRIKSSVNKYGMDFLLWKRCWVGRQMETAVYSTKKIKVQRQIHKETRTNGRKITIKIKI